MGFFDALKNAANEANEAAHGERLKSGLASTISCVGALDDKVRAVALIKFIEKRKKLQERLPNWSRDGRIKVGRKLQDEARKCFDLDQAESYALWLAGAWIESGERESAAANYVHHALEELVNQITE